ncbi:MAG: hypothetical protein Q9213_006210 [Squamulea squamosa]
MHAIYLTALLGSLVAPAATKTGPAGFAQTAKYDNLTGTPGVVVNPVGNSGLYQKIIWGFLTLPGVTPYSLTNAIAWGTTDIQTVLSGPAAMDTNYALSNVQYLELKRLRFGCVSATKASPSAVPVSCDVTLTCNRADGTRLSQKFQFRIPSGQLKASMVQAEPVGFTKCTSVRFGNPAAVVPGVGAVYAGLADNAEYNYFV